MVDILGYEGLYAITENGEVWSYISQKFLKPIKEHNGYIAIYTVDSFGKETLKETTEIVTTYLPQTDIKQLKEGIKVFNPNMILVIYV